MGFLVTDVSDFSLTCRRIHRDANGYICAHMLSDTQLLGNHMSQNVLPGGQTADPSSEILCPLEPTHGAHKTLTPFKTSQTVIGNTGLKSLVLKLYKGYERLSAPLLTSM